MNRKHGGIPIESSAMGICDIAGIVSLIATQSRTGMIALSGVDLAGRSPVEVWLPASTHLERMI